MRFSLPRILLAALLLSMFVTACDHPIKNTNGLGQSKPSKAKPILELANGQYLGDYSAERDVQTFLGLPFAQAPVGELRWAAPQALAKNDLQNPRQASEFAPACMQGPHLANWYKGVIESFDGDASLFPTPEYSEDCLYLNVWAPAEPTKEPLPVFVFIHGGSNKGGWSYEPNYIGENMAKEGAVVVTIAYRLGVFGFFAHPDLEQANFALLDQIAAIKWIKQNISAVNGDPANITIAGESAGASNIAYLMAAPAAKGLFQRAIHQSGGWAMYRTEPKQAIEPLGLELAKAVTGNVDSSISDLRAISASAMQVAAETTYQNHFFDPVIDGDTVTKPLAESARLGDLAKIDLMIGTNANESRMYLDKNETIQSWMNNNLAKRAKGVSADAIVATLASGDGIDSLARLDQLATGFNYTCPSFNLASANAAIDNQTWFYNFTKQRDGELGAKMGAYHGAELPYVFNTHDDWLPTSEADTQLSERMMSYWLNFARSGNPNSDGLPPWGSYSTSGDAIQYLGVNIKSAAHPSAELCQLLVSAAQKNYSN